MLGGWFPDDVASTPPCLRRSNTTTQDVSHRMWLLHPKGSTTTPSAAISHPSTFGSSRRITRTSGQGLPDGSPRRLSACHSITATPPRHDPVGATRSSLTTSQRNRFCRVPPAYSSTAFRAPKISGGGQFPPRRRHWLFCLLVLDGLRACLYRCVLQSRKYFKMASTRFPRFWHKLPTRQAQLCLD